jgi:hypothetical protein
VRAPRARRNVLICHSRFLPFLQFVASKANNTRKADAFLL